MCGSVLLATEENREKKKKIDLLSFIAHRRGTAASLPLLSLCENEGGPTLCIKRSAPCAGFLLCATRNCCRRWRESRFKIETSSSVSFFSLQSLGTHAPAAGYVAAFFFFLQHPFISLLLLTFNLFCFISLSFLSLVAVFVLSTA